MVLTQAQAAARLGRLLALPGNERCADCPTRRPKWASINLGVFMCLRCSGCHRGLGVQISKVRSVTLDTWVERDLDRMASVGNTRGNAEWMARAPDGLKLPTTSSSMEELQAFIVRKYTHKEWFSPAPPNSTTASTAPADDRDPFAISSEVSVGADPFGDQSFDGRSPRPSGSSVLPAESYIAANPFGSSSGGRLILDGFAPAVRGRTTPTFAGAGTSKWYSNSTDAESQDPFGSAAAIPAGLQEWVDARYNAADPFGEGAEDSSGGSGSTPAWVVAAGETHTLPTDAKITVYFVKGEPLGLGFAARASFNPGTGSVATSVATVQPEQRDAFFDAYSTAVVRLNSSSGPAAAAGLEAGWIVARVHATDLRGENHSDVLRRIRDAIAPVACVDRQSSFAIEFWRPPTISVGQTRKPAATNSSLSNDSAVQHNRPVSQGRPLESPRVRVMPETPPRQTSANSLQAVLRAASDADLEAEVKRRGFSLTRIANPQPDLRFDELDAFFEQAKGPMFAL